VVLKLLDQSTEANRPASITTELLIAFAEASGDIDANDVSCSPFVQQIDSSDDY